MPSVGGRVVAMHAISDRIQYWLKILRQAVLPQIAAAFAVFGTIFSIRDEFLSPELAARLKMPAWLPDLPWYLWTIALLSIVLIAVMEGAYRQQRSIRPLEDKRQEHFKELIGGYSPDLRTALQVLIVTDNPERIGAGNWSQFHQDGLVDSGTNGQWRTRGGIKKDLINVVSAALKYHEQ
jgi:hypothetical protein